MLLRIAISKISEEILPSEASFFTASAATPISDATH